MNNYKYYICRNVNELRFVINLFGGKYYELFQFSNPILAGVNNNIYSHHYYIGIDIIPSDINIIETKNLMRYEKLKRINGN